MSGSGDAQASDDGAGERTPLPSEPAARTGASSDDTSPVTRSEPPADPTTERVSEPQPERGSEPHAEGMNEPRPERVSEPQRERVASRSVSV